MLVILIVARDLSCDYDSSASEHEGEAAVDYCVAGKVTGEGREEGEGVGGTNQDLLRHH